MLNAKKMRKACLVTVAVLAMLVVMVLGLVSCNAPEVSSVQYVDGSLSKTTYEVGQTVDVTGAQIKVTYADGTSKTVDVTPAMVGTVPAVAAGTMDVVISYTENGKEFGTKMTVTVTNTLADKQAEAAGKVDANVTAEDLADDTINSMTQTYKNAIYNCKDVEAINNIVTAHKNWVEAYKAAKADAASTLAAAKVAAAAAINGVDLSGIFEKNLPAAQAQMQAALADVEAALTPAQAAATAEGFIGYVAGVLQGQAYMESDNLDPETMMEQKIQIMNDLRTFVEDFLESPWYSEDAKNTIALNQQNAIERILMAQDMVKVQTVIVPEVLDLIADTDSFIDEVYYAYIAIGDVHYVDSCDDLIEDAEILRDKCFAIDAVEATEALTAYSRRTPENVEVNLLAGAVESLYDDSFNGKFEGITAKRDRYNQLGVAASVAVFGLADRLDPTSVVYDANGTELVSVINMINAIGDVNVLTLSKIEAAYAAYEAWALHFEIADPATATTDDYYGVDLYDGFDGNDKDVIVTNYPEMFQKWEECIEMIEQRDEDLEEVIDLIKAIGDVLIGVEGEVRVDGETPVDSKAAIEAARAAFDAFMDNEGYLADDPTMYDEYFCAYSGSTLIRDYGANLAKAESDYAALEAKVAAIDEMIGRLLNNFDHIDVVVDGNTLNNVIKPAIEAFAAINCEMDGSEVVPYLGIIAQYDYYLACYARWEVEMFKQSYKDQAKTAIADHLATFATAANYDELAEIAENYVVVIEAMEYDTNATLAENYAALEAVAVECCTEITAAAE